MKFKYALYLIILIILLFLGYYYKIEIPIAEVV